MSARNAKCDVNVTEVPGKRREEDRSGGGWNQERLVRERIVGEEVQDRIKWRHLIRNIDPT